MIKQRTELRREKNWIYERYLVHSKVLGRDFHCGRFRPDSTLPVARTFFLLHGGGADDAQAVQAGLLPVLAQSSELVSDSVTQFIFPFVGNSFLHQHPADPSKSFSEYFLTELLPSFAETTPPENTLLGGWSMGGQAALNLFLRHPARFGGVGAHFATLIHFDYTDPAQVAGYAVRQNVTGPMQAVLVSEFESEFADAGDFAKHDPLQLAQGLPPTVLENKKIYFDVGENDEFGLSEGASVLHDILLQKKVVHRFEILPHGLHNVPFIHTQIPKMIAYLLGNGG